MDSRLNILNFEGFSSTESTWQESELSNLVRGGSKLLGLSSSASRGRLNEVSLIMLIQIKTSGEDSCDMNSKLSDIVGRNKFD
jgi:hypothetical protein